MNSMHDGLVWSVGPYPKGRECAHNHYTPLSNMQASSSRLVTRNAAGVACRPALLPLRAPRRVSAFLDSSDPAPAAPKTRTRRAKPDADRIKRAPSAYNLFFKAKFPEVKAAAPDTKAVELTGTLSKMWQSLPEDQRAPFEAEANILKEAVAAKR